jgi:hypothetical protein
MKKNILLAAILISFFASACDEQSNKPYVKIAGGGFMFNYRYSIMSYGFVVKPLRPLPEGSTLEASFDIPDSPEKFVLTLPAVAGKMQYGFETQALHGVKKGVPYKARLRLLEAGTGKELALMEKDFRSDVEQSSLPTKAPVRGIGYFPAPQ